MGATWSEAHAAAESDGLAPADPTDQPERWTPHDECAETRITETGA